MDWMDKKREDVFSYEMVDPFSLDSTRGYLDGVISGSPSLTFGYDTNTRVSGSLEAIPKNYVDYSLIRIYHDVPKWGYHNELGTFFVSDRNGSYGQRTYKRTFNLTSMLDRISEDALVNNFCIAQDQNAHQMLTNLLNLYAVPFTMDSYLNNKVYTGAIVYEVGENVLETVLDIAAEANIDVNVNGHGTVILSNHVIPSKTSTPVFYFGDNNGTIDGEISENIDLFGTVNRVVAYSSKTENDNEMMVSGYADRSTDSISSYNKLGRRNTAVESISDLEPFSNEGARSQANNILIAEHDDTPIEYTFSGLYIPYDTGSVISLTIDNVEHICTIKNKNVKLQPGMITSYTVREV